MRFEHVERSDAEAVIVIEGLQRELTLVHLTDSHLTEVDERDPEMHGFAPERRAEFEALSPGGVPTRARFQRALDRSRELGADCLVLTGDIMDFPSSANLQAVEDGLGALGLPYLYTPGNHDWHFPYLPWSDETRARFYPRFAGLAGGNPAFGTYDIAGIRLLTVDNSNYQITDAQLEFLRAQLAAGPPCLLFMHIPIALPSLAPDVMQRWKAPIMMAAGGWTAETQAAWHVRDTDRTTQLCHDLLTGGSAKNLAGIFCGHVHFAHADAFGDGQMQYVGAPGFEGGYRVIRLLPG